MEQEPTVVLGSESQTKAQVSKNEVMNVISSQTETPQTGVKEQPVNGNGVVDQKVVTGDVKTENPVWKPKEGPYSPWGSPTSDAQKTSQPEKSHTEETDVEDSSGDKDIPALLSEKEEWELFEQDTSEGWTTVTNALEAGDEVQLRDFLKAGLGLADMPQYLQRGETKKNEKDLEGSLIRSKGFFRPIEVVPARKFIEAGLGTPTRLDGTPIKLTDHDIDYLYVRPDGKQRSCAYANLFSSKKYKGKEGEFDVRVKICPSPIKDIPTYVREIQTAAVWDEKTKRQTTAALFNSAESGLSLMNLFIEESGMTARGAYKLIYYKDGYKKSLYEESASTGTLHKSLEASPDIIKRAKHNYEAMKIAFRSAHKYLKNSAAVDALIDVFVSATDHQNEAVEEFLTFLKTLGAEEFKELDDAKTVADKKNVFLSIFEEFKNELATTPTFKDDVVEMVKTAEDEYKAASTKAKKTTKKVKASCEKSYYEVGAHTED